MFLKKIGLTSQDVGIKINSRKVLQEILAPLILEDLFNPVCIIIDKLDKLGEEEITRQLLLLNLDMSIIDIIKATLNIKSIDQLKTMLPSSGVIVELEGLWILAKAYEFDDWLEFDASIVRGLSYYTGIVFEGFAKQHKLRAIFGGGRYDKLLTTYGAKQDLPACGFGFGDCVIFELLKEKKLIPTLNSDIDVVVICFDESLRIASYKVANKLRSRNITVDVQLITDKKVSWCYAYANRIGADKCILLAPEEWLQRESVIIKELKAKELTEHEIKFDDL